jgi:hypothetical protein
LTPKRTRKTEAVVDEDSDFIRNANTKTAMRDEFSIFGEHVAQKIRNLKDRRSQSVAEFEISSILFQIEMGTYRYSTHPHISDASTQSCPSAVQLPDSGAKASQISPPTQYSALSPVVILRSGSSPAPDSGSPNPQTSQPSPQSLHSHSSVPEDIN